MANDRPVPPTPPADDPLCWNGGWRSAERPTLGDFAERASRLLARLRPLLPAMEQLRLFGRRPGATANPWETADAVVRWALSQAWEPRPPSTARYDALDAEGRPTAASRGRMGFGIELGTRQDLAPQLRVSISDAGPEGGGVALLLPGVDLASFIEGDGFVALWREVGALWPVQFGTTTTRAWNAAVHVQERGWVLRPVGGLTYSSDPTVAEAAPSSARVRTLPGGGIEIGITDRPDLLQPEHVAQAIGFRQRLADLGMLRLWQLPD